MRKEREEEVREGGRKQRRKEGRKEEKNNCLLQGINDGQGWLGYIY